MFDSLQKRLSGALSKVRGKAKLSEADVSALLSEIRTGLLEADVHFRVTKDFLARVKEKCLRQEVMGSLSAEQQVLRVLEEELKSVLGTANSPLSFDSKPPAVFLMCGLQGSGKTTSSVKLALHLKKSGKRVAVVSVDTQRPAAMDQLASLAKKNEIDCLAYEASCGAVAIAKQAHEDALTQNYEVLIIDTAGRLQVDEALMQELKDIKQATEPTERLLVIDSMMGQQAVEVSDSFDSDIDVTGSILTKLDGDTRGGAALSIVATTGKPIKFIGVGERATEFEPFHPDRMASRLLDMGDVLTLLDRAQEAISEEEAMEAAQKLQSGGKFTLEDFQSQMKMITKMGPLGSIMKMMPGMGALSEQLDSADAEKELKRVDAIINSMTPKERKQPEILNGSRRSRIARGSGMEVSHINQFIKKFQQMQKMMKKMGKLGGMFGGGNPFGGGGAGGGGNPFGGGFPGGGAPGGGRGGGKGFGRKF